MGSIGNCGQYRFFVRLFCRRSAVGYGKPNVTGICLDVDTDIAVDNRHTLTGKRAHVFGITADYGERHRVVAFVIVYGDDCALIVKRAGKRILTVHQQKLLIVAVAERFGMLPRFSECGGKFCVRIVFECVLIVFIGQCGTQ